MLSELATLKQIETELKKRWVYPYQWGKIQNNQDDTLTRLVYDVLYFEDVLAELERKLNKHPQQTQLFNYALNRWYNFWSAKAIEQIFAQSQWVKPNPEPKDKLKDFELRGIPFDHKSTVFPKAYPYNIEQTLEQPIHLIEWLYQHQSQEQRQHYSNRLFVVFYEVNQNHWKLKAEITWLKTVIESYLKNFTFERLKTFQFAKDHLTQADIIWAVSELKT